jgi:hypothetical protein
MKKTVQFSGILAATLVAGLLFFAACKKDNANSNEDATELSLAAQDDAEADAVFDDVFTNVMGTDDDAGIGTGIGVFGFSGSTSSNPTGREMSTDSITPCFTVTRVPVTPSVFPKTITLDFGTGCMGLDGHTRRGKIITVYTGRMIVPGSQATTTFVNYYIDSLHVEGSHVVKNNSTGSVRVFTRTVTNGKITKPSGNYIQWNATHTIAQTAGLGTPLYPLDDEFDITGNANGENYHNGHSISWSHNITNPLHKKFTCRWFGSGTIVFTVNSHTATLDYGGGNCDNQATLLIGGQTIPITLH